MWLKRLWRWQRRRRCRRPSKRNGKKREAVKLATSTSKPEQFLEAICSPNIFRPARMVLHGFVIVTRRGGGDGSTFPMVRERVLLGRAEDCDIR